MGSTLHVHIIQHSPTLPAAAYLDWVRERGYALTLTKQYEGMSLADAPEDPDLLVLTGGPQDFRPPYGDTLGADFPAEFALLRRQMEAGRMLVGTCLGAQMIPYALSGRLDKSPEREIGCFPMDLTEEGKADPLWQDYPDHLLVGHWHSNMPALIPESSILAESAGCPRQVVRYAPLVYGIQAHLEFTRESMAYLLSTIPKELPAKRHPYVWTKAQLLNFDYGPMNRALMDFLDRLVERYRSKKR